MVCGLGLSKYGVALSLSLSLGLLQRAIKVEGTDWWSVVGDLRDLSPKKSARGPDCGMQRMLASTRRAFIAGTPAARSICTDNLE